MPKAVEKGLLAAVLFASCVYFAFGLTSIAHVSFVGDEPEDLMMAAGFPADAMVFFQNIYAPDQARLPHLVAMPFLLLFQKNALISLRILFFLFHFLYVWISYRLILLTTGRRSAALVYALLIVTSLFLQSFSIFAMTTGDSLLLLLHISSFYLFCRGYLQQKEAGYFSPWVPFILCLGLCVASKLFGVFLAAALFLFSVMDRGISGVRVRDGFLRGLQVLSGLFIILILGLNFSPMVPSGKSLLSFAAGLVYFVFLLRFMKREQALGGRTVRLSKFEFWATTALAAFNVFLIFSPSYLNLKNLFWPADWVQSWGRGDVAQFSHFYDVSLIAVIKYGVPSFLVLVISFFIFLFFPSRYRQNEKRTGWFFALTTLVFAVHFLVVSSARFKSTWYPLAVFPFLYLPFVWMWLRAEQERSKPRFIFLIICLCAVITDNVYRYALWFPYGHFDGAQYGRKFIGWDKPAYVSFEAAPLIYEALNEPAFLPAGGRTRVSCQFISIPRYNGYATSSLQNYFELAKGNSRFAFSAGTENQGDLLLTSPLFDPAFENTLGQDPDRYAKLKTISIKGIDMVSVWRPKKP